MLQHGECRNLSKTRQLVHHWGKEDCFHLLDKLLLQRYIHGSLLGKQRLVLSEIFSSGRLFLGTPHDMRLVTWVVWRHKCEACLLHVLLGRHRQREVSVSASSEV